MDLTGTVGQKLSVRISAETKGLLLQGPQYFDLAVGPEQVASFNLPVKALLDGRWVINLIVQKRNRRWRSGWPRLGAGGAGGQYAAGGWRPTKSYPE